MDETTFGDSERSRIYEPHSRSERRQPHVD